MKSLDLEKLVFEIQQRPVIWDVGCSEYSNREKKKNAWEEIVNLFTTEETTVDEKKNVGEQLHHRWKSLRDCYAREVRLQKQTKSGSGSRTRSTYVYFQQLTFLEKVIATQSFSNSLIDNEELLTTPSSSHQRSTSPVSKKRKNDPVADRLLQAVEMSIQERQKRESEVENDSDRMFLLSLLNPLKQIPEYARFAVKRKVMDLMDSELQFYRHTLANHRQHQFHQPIAHDTPVYVQFSPTSNSSTSLFNAGLQHTSSQHVIIGETSRDSPHSNSSAVTSPSSDLDIFDKS